MPRLNIVGQKFRGLDPSLPGIVAGCEVFLVREPLNPYDDNAVAVWIDGVHVGYLSKKENPAIAKRIDAEGISNPVGIAQDGTVVFQPKAIKAKFARSPNSSYPQVQIDD
jgi:hypothetical protein